jgi:hypothetical protein
MTRWSADIIRGRGARAQHLGTFEAPDQREAYRIAIEKFDVPVEHQNCLYVSQARLPGFPRRRRPSP